ncbi:3-oxoacyl-[acyl-carrier-protein] synthase III C-terminal domain-containing protein [Streptomyces cellulosae]
MLDALADAQRGVPGGAALGCGAAAAFDVNAACSGFSHAEALADALLRAGTARQVLVVASERMSDWVAANDRNTGPIFADGASAAVVVPADRPQIFPVAWGSDGSQAHLIAIDPLSRRMAMQGRKVFRWTTSALLPVIQSSCVGAGLSPSQRRAFVPHQANLRIIDLLSRALGVQDLIVADDVVHAGNTCSASVPLALHELVQREAIRTGDPVLLFGFGAGLTYAAQVVLCP